MQKYADDDNSEGMSMDMMDEDEFGEDEEYGELVSFEGENSQQLSESQDDESMEPIVTKSKKNRKWDWLCDSLINLLNC